MLLTFVQCLFSPSFATSDKDHRLLKDFSIILKTKFKDLIQPCHVQCCCSLWIMCIFDCMLVIPTALQTELAARNFLFDLINKLKVKMVVRVFSFTGYDLPAKCKSSFWTCHLLTLTVCCVCCCCVLKVFFAHKYMVFLFMDNCSLNGVYCYCISESTELPCCFALSVPVWIDCLLNSSPKRSRSIVLSWMDCETLPAFMHVLFC